MHRADCLDPSGFRVAVRVAQDDPFNRRAPDSSGSATRPQAPGAFCLLAHLPGSSLSHVVPAEPDALTEFTRRLFGAALTKGRIQPWEGVTWVLDLLPEAPRKALHVIDAYLDVHAGLMPDGRLMGMSDARAIIRAKYTLVGDIEGCERALDNPDVV